ncbi:hypothetical protein [Hymenobacter lucidus]|uniref:Uncharacterized protein n=1 Tax=Hymenobacter lucidus TaxID=2880930 RepID=A0ABS8AT41_9BACT|nr:hypothetical protein [Hymenobacter lucidus]MCB2408212.1 hypothetical protein [Hymenobacter lucidus]
MPGRQQKNNGPEPLHGAESAHLTPQVLLQAPPTEADPVQDFTTREFAAGQW